MFLRMYSQVFMTYLIFVVMILSLVILRFIARSHLAQLV
jgi:hypothetical protein